MVYLRRGGLRTAATTLMVLLLSVAAKLSVAQENATEVNSGGNCLDAYRPFHDGFDSEAQTQESFRGLFAFVVVFFGTFPFALLFPQYLHLPMLNGWIVAGVLSGPYVLNVVTEQTLKVWGGHIEDFGFAFIGLTSGFMLYCPDLLPVIRDLKLQVIPIVLSCVVVIGIIVSVVGDQLGSFMGDYELNYTCKLLIGLAFGAIMSTGSPAEVVALIHELKPKGPIVVLAVGATITKDVSAIVIVSIVDVALNIECGDGFSNSRIPLFVAGLLASVIFGILLGMVYVALLLVDLPLVIHGAAVLGSAWSVYEFEAWLYTVSSCHELPFRIECLFLIVVASAVVSNNERTRERFRTVIEKFSTYVFLIFFCYVGAHLGSPSFPPSLPPALLPSFLSSFLHKVIALPFLPSYSTSFLLSFICSFIYSFLSSFLSM
jgi:hypothetical protein